MAENNQPMIVRSTLLTNSAAEFVENRIDSALGMGISAGAQAEFVPELDRFRSQDRITEVDYYAESKKRIKLFEETLERFSQTLEKHDLAKKIDIAIKKPSEYNLKDVINIADKVYERHKTAPDVKSCTGAIRKCFRFAGRNASPLQCLLNFVPSDSYGSVISGGFTVILAAAERVESLRESIYAALEAIPEKLRIVQALSEIHYRSINLYLAADSVFVCLFKVLDRIIEELSKSIAKKGFKAVIKGKAYGKEIDQALKDLEEALSSFKEEAHVCSEQRLGRLEDHMLSVKRSLARLEGNQEETRRRDRLEARERRAIEGQDGLGPVNVEILMKRAKLGVLNMSYKLLTSSEAFDSRTGTARKSDYLLVQDVNQPLLISSRSVTPEPSPRVNKKALKKWFARLPLDFVSAAERDISESLQHNLHRTDQDKVQYIMTSEKLLGWLEKPESGLLIIQGQSAPQTQANAISLSSAFLAQSLRQSQPGPVLYHSCGLRTEEGSRGAETSGTTALANSLSSQLARRLQGRADLSFLAADRHRRKSKGQARLRPALKLLRRLVGEVPGAESVFVIVDSLSRLSGDAEDEGEAIRGVSRLAGRRSGGPVVKVLLTDLLPGHMAQRPTDGDELYVPDRVDAGGQGLNAEYLREVAGASIGRFKARGHGGDSSSGSGDSSEETGSSESEASTSYDDSD